MMSTFALGQIQVRRSGYGAMQLAGPYAFGPPPDRASAIGVLRAAVAAASALIEPAPTTRTRSPASGRDGSAGPASASRARATAMPMLTRFAPAWSIPVSAWARLAVRSASVPSSPRPRLSVPWFSSKPKTILCRQMEQISTSSSSDKSAAT